MKIGKIVAAVVLLTMGASLSAQDLASAARKEKERRANLKDKPAATVTNADLARTKKKAAITQAPGAEQAQPVAAEGVPAEPGNKPTAVAAESSEAVVAEEAVDIEALRAELQDKYNRAKERLDYLNLKMRALQQQFFSFNTMESKAKVQQDIVETNANLQAAVAEETSLKKELEDFASKNPIK